MKNFFRSLTGKNRQTFTDDDNMTVHFDDATALMEQVPTSPANHADFLTTAEQQAINDAARPIHDADSLSTGTRQLDYLKRLASWGEVKVSEAKIRANQDYLNQASMNAALKAALRRQKEAEERTVQAESEVEEAKAACSAVIGASATARVEQEYYGWRRIGLLSLVILAFFGEVVFNYMGLSFFSLGQVPTYFIAFGLAVVLFAGAQQVAHSFQDRHPARWVALVSFLLVLVSVSVMLTVLRDAAATLAIADASGLGPSGADSSSASTDHFLRVTSFIGLIAMQIAFPLTIAFIELLDRPEARAYHQALQRLTNAKKEEDALKQKHPDLPERIETAEMRFEAVQERISNEAELIRRSVADAQDVYVSAYLQAAGSPEVTTAMGIRLDAVEQRGSSDREN